MERQNTVVADDGDGGLVPVTPCHMYGLPDENCESMTADCPVCLLMATLREKFGSRMPSRFAYYAAGWIPELCEQWLVEHRRVWTTEEVAAINAHMERPPSVERVGPSHLASNAKLWREAFFGKNWKDHYFVLSGVFLFIFPSDQKRELATNVLLIRGANIVRQRDHSTKLFTIRIIPIGCDRCHRRTSRFNEEVVIGFKEESVMFEWLEMLSYLSQICPHMCSSKFANNLTPMREVCEALLAAAFREEKREVAQERRRAAKAAQPTIPPSEAEA
jgi:hypothetical protein